MKVYVCYSYYYDSWKLETIFKTEEHAKEWKESKNTADYWNWSYDYEPMEVEE
jgi:hypothetical protein